MTRPKPNDGDDYRSYALIENALAKGFHDAGLFVSLSRRMELGEMVWDQLTPGERKPIVEHHARPAGDSGEEGCVAVYAGPAGSLYTGFTCEMPRGHDGRHAVGSLGQGGATWEDRP